MTALLLRLLRRTLVWAVVAVGAIVLFRAWDSQRGAPLEPWHTYVPADMHATEIDKSDWAAYLRHEEAIFRDVRREVVDKVAGTPPVRSIATLPAARSIPATSSRTSTAPTSSSPTARRSARWCCCTA